MEKSFHFVRPWPVFVAQLRAALSDYRMIFTGDWLGVKRIQTIVIEHRFEGRFWRYLPPMAVDYLEIRREDGPVLYTNPKLGATEEIASMLELRERMLHKFNLK